MSYYWSSRNILHYIGEVIFYSSFTFLFPLFFSFVFREGRSVYFVYFLIFVFAFLFGYFLKNSIKKKKILGSNNLFSITLTQALIVVVFVWVLYVFFTALPFYFLSSDIALIDGMFETMSSLTTTGLSMYPSLTPPLKSLSLWRSFLSWIGGLGIIMISYFGLMRGAYGSAKLFSAEGHERTRPNIKKTIISIWLIYLSITLIGAFFFNIFGMNTFDSFSYSMSAISTTESKPSFQKLEAIGSTPIYLVLIIMMFLGGSSFFLHYNFYFKKSFKEYFKDTQFKVYLSTILISTLIIFILARSSYSLITILLTVVGMMTGGGFTTIAGAKFLTFSPLIILFFMFLMFVGASTGSTSGGIKIERLVLAVKSIFWKIRQINLPDIAYFSKKYNNQVISDSKIKLVYFLILMYFLFVLFGVIMFISHGFGLQESFFEVISAQSNVGITTGIINNSIPIILKLTVMINMWVGRLEIIPILSIIGVLFYRRKLI